LFTIFNHEIYAKHYPCNTTEDIEAFIQDFGWSRIYQFLQNEEVGRMYEIRSLQQDYVKKLKKETDLFGNVKEDAVIQNLIAQSEFQCQFENAVASLEFSENMTHEAVMDGALSVDTANHILKSINAERHYMWHCVGVFVIVLCVIGVLTVF